jgi:hypothetical protein
MPPTTVMAAEAGSHSVRSSFSAHSAAAMPHARNPNAPTATMTPASGGL